MKNLLLLAVLWGSDALANQEKFAWDYTGSSGEKYSCVGYYDTASYGDRQLRDIFALATWHLPDEFEPPCARFNTEVSSSKIQARKEKLNQEKESLMTEFDDHVARLKAMKLRGKFELEKDQKVGWALVLKDISNKMYDFAIQNYNLTPIKGQIAGQAQSPDCISILDKAAKLSGVPRCQKITGEWRKCILGQFGPKFDHGGQGLNDETVKTILKNVACKQKEQEKKEEY